MWRRSCVLPVVTQSRQFLADKLHLIGSCAQKSATIPGHLHESLPSAKCCALFKNSEGRHSADGKQATACASTACQLSANYFRRNCAGTSGAVGTCSSGSSTSQ